VDAFEYGIVSSMEKNALAGAPGVLSKAVGGIRNIFKRAPKKTSVGTPLSQISSAMPPRPTATAMGSRSISTPVSQLKAPGVAAPAAAPPKPKPVLALEGQANDAKIKGIKKGLKIGLGGATAVGVGAGAINSTKKHQPPARAPINEPGY